MKLISFNIFLLLLIHFIKNQAFFNILNWDLVLGDILY